MSADTRSALARYRHEIFVQKLGWSLPVVAGQEPERELDDFDRGDALYIIALNDAGEICGCGRLLPTTGPYLSQKFPELMVDIEAPSEAGIWEFSRLAVTPSRLAGSAAGQASRQLLSAVVGAALAQGAYRLICVGFASLPRWYRRFGIQARCAGPSKVIDGEATIIYWLDLDGQTCTALGIDPNLPIQTRIRALQIHKRVAGHGATIAGATMPSIVRQLAPRAGRAMHAAGIRHESARPIKCDGHLRGDRRNR